MISRTYIGYRLPGHTVDVEPGRLRFFAKAIGETNPVYTSEAEALAAGHPGLPVPPTFLFCLDMEVPEPYAYLDEMGVELGRVLHAEQTFKYFRPAYAGDRLTFRSQITDIFSKRNGALEFLVRETDVHNQDHVPVARLRSVIVVRQDTGRMENKPSPSSAPNPCPWTLELSLPPVSRLTLALYAGASGDHNPIHVDIDFAREHGLDDVIAHGMLATAYLGRMLTDWLPQPAIRSLDVRFVRAMHVHEQLTCLGEIVETWSRNETPLSRLELQVINQQQAVKITGVAVVTSDPTPLWR